MNGSIKFFHPEETFLYKIEKCLHKVVWLDKKSCLLIEVHSTDELDHLDEDSLQSEHPQVVLTLDDFPVDAENPEALIGQTLEIPSGIVEVEDEEGDLEDVLYTNLNVVEDDYETNNNVLTFTQNDKGETCLRWKGKCEDFTGITDEVISFEVQCVFSDNPIVLKDDDVPNVHYSNSKEKEKPKEKPKEKKVNKQ